MPITQRIHILDIYLILFSQSCQVQFHLSVRVIADLSNLISLLLEARFSMRHPYNRMILSKKIEGLPPPGHRVAAPSTQAGPPNMTCFCFGSSNSAALTSRAANINYDYLQSIFLDQAPDSDFSTFGVPILKAALVHGCIWNKPGEKLGEILKTDNKGKKIKDWISKWLGYGVADFEKALGCNQQKATLLGFGRLEDGEAHVYQLPLPPSLNAQREWRRFTVTLAWLSPVASTTQRYRKAQLWFDFEDGKKSRKKIEGKTTCKWH